VDVGAKNPLGVVVEDDGAVHLREFEQSLRRERSVDRKAAVAHVVDGRLIADDNQSARTGRKNHVQALAEASAWCDFLELFAKHLSSPLVDHRGSRLIRGVG